VRASASFFAGVACGLAFLGWNGALQDYYLQTVAFPQAFYLAAASGDAGAGPIGRTVSQITAFVTLQRDQPLWIVIRAVLFAGAIVALARRRPTDDLVPIAIITAFLWLAAYPSANFMHQWWTASFAIPPFVACIHEAVAVRLKPLGAWATAAVVMAIVAPGLQARARGAAEHIRDMRVGLVEPAVLRGIRTTPECKNAFELIDHVIEDYRARHPGAGIVSIESADGWTGGQVESLLFLSIADDNHSPLPIFWRLPVLSTQVYAGYAAQFWKQVRERRPLVIDHRAGPYTTAHIAGYATLAVVESDTGYWYVYAPEDATERPTFLAWDGSLRRGFSDNALE